MSKVALQHNREFQVVLQRWLWQEVDLEVEVEDLHVEVI